MNKFLKLLSATALATVMSTALYATDVPALKGRVNDYTGKMSSDQIDMLTRNLQHIEQYKSGHPQFVALLVPDMAGEDVKDYAQDVFHDWKLGQAGLDNGMLMLISLKERKVRIQTGYGLEGDLPDTRTKEIIDNAMIPKIKQSDFFGAFNAGATSASSYIKAADTTTDEPGYVSVKGKPTDATIAQEEHHSGFGTFLFWVLLIGGGGFWIYRILRKREDPITSSNETYTPKWRDNTSYTPQPRYNPTPSYTPPEHHDHTVTGAVLGGLAGYELGKAMSEPEDRKRRADDDGPSYSSPSPSRSSSRSSDSDSSSSSRSSSSDWGSSSSSSGSSDSFSGGGGDSGGGGSDGGW